MVCAYSSSYFLTPSFCCQFATVSAISMHSSLVYISRAIANFESRVLINQFLFVCDLIIDIYPRSQHAVSYLKILNSLLSPATTTRFIGSQGPLLSAEITQYLMNRNFYQLLSKAIITIVSFASLIHVRALRMGWCSVGCANSKQKLRMVTDWPSNRLF